MSTPLLEFFKIIFELILAFTAVISPILLWLNNKLIRPVKGLDVRVSQIQDLHNQRSEHLDNLTVTLRELEKGVKNNSNAHEKANEILKELKPNGGGSMNDKIVSIFNNLKDINYSIDYMMNLSMTQLDLIPIPVWKSNKKGENIFINESYKEFFEIDFENTKGYKWTTLVHPEDLKVYTASWEDTLKYKQDVTTLVRAVKFRSREVVPCKVNWKVVQDKKGEILYILGRVTVITNDFYNKVKN